MIELPTEWVFENLSITKWVDGNGKMIVLTNSETDADLIRLTLNTLNIIFEEDESNFNNWLVGFEFNIEDTKKDCPSLYESMNKLNVSKIERRLKRIQI